MWRKLYRMVEAVKRLQSNLAIASIDEVSSALENQPEHDGNRQVGGAGNRG